MKSPDDVKKGLRCLSHDRTHTLPCSDCEYHGQGLPPCRTAVHEDAIALIEQLEAERDALMHYLHSMGCDTCLYDDYDGSEPPCINCTATRDLWQFQGVQKEE